MQNSLQKITLKHLMINSTPKIGLQFFPNKILNALIKSLPGIRWSKEFNMAYISNNQENVQLIFDTFRGVAWVNGNYFFDKKPVNTSNHALEQKTIEKIKKNVPKEYIDKLVIKRY